MTDRMHENDEQAIERIAQALRPLPAVDPAAKARVLVAVAADRNRRAESGARVVTRRVALVAAVLAAIVPFAVFAIARGRDRHPAAPSAALASVPSAAAAGPAAPMNTRLASDANDVNDAPSESVQLVVRLPNAHRVAVVGDFTGWDQRRIPMHRDAASGLWSATVTVRPGRHVYAFVADDSIWTRDPRAPIATDPDFGTPGSLLLVGKP